MLEGCLDGVHKRAAATRTGSFEATKAEAIGLCLNGLEDRFGNLLIDQTRGDEPSCNSITAVVRDMFVFNVDACPTNPQDLVVFGNEQIERLTHWFEPVLANAGCRQVHKIPDQWLSIKVQINTSFRDKDYGSLWQTLLTKKALSPGLSKCPSPCRDSVGTTDFCSSVRTCHLRTEPDKE